MNRRLEYFHAASGLLFVVTMIAGWFFVAANGMPDLSAAQPIYDAYGENKDKLLNAILVMTIGFFFSLWFGGVVLGRMRRVEGEGPLTFIALGGFLSFVTVFMAGLAMGLGNALVFDRGVDPDVIYVMHTVSLVTGVTTAVCGPCFFIPIAILSFARDLFPRWLAWLSVAAAVGTVTPIVGNYSVSGPLNVGNGVIGVHTIAGTWGIWAAAVSVWMLRQLRHETQTTSGARSAATAPA